MEQSDRFESGMQMILDNLIKSYDQSIQLSLELNRSLLPPIDPDYCSTYSNLIYTPIKPKHSYDPSSTPQGSKRKRTFSSEQIQASRRLFRIALANPDPKINDNADNVLNKPTSSFSSNSSTQVQPNQTGKTVQKPIHDLSRSFEK